MYQCYGDTQPKQGERNKRENRVRLQETVVSPGGNLHIYIKAPHSRPCRFILSTPRSLLVRVLPQRTVGKTLPGATAPVLRLAAPVSLLTIDVH
jgi:hypothetical protein